MNTFNKVVFPLGITLLLTACGSNSNSSEDNNTIETELTQKEILGKALFFDESISLNRNVSCATCHDADKAFIDARFSLENADQGIFIHGAFSVGSDGTSLGGRNAPTASYAQFSPTFEKQEDGTYRGGQFHDGRAATLKIQAMGPPLDGAEMQMVSKSAVVDRLKENEEYIESFKTLYGENIFDDINATYEAMAESIAQFETTEDFAPFDSKYDRWKKGKDDSDYYEMTLDEDLGYSLFFGGLGTSNANTSCAACHLQDPNTESTNELFTNFEYENIGTPRHITAMNARVNLGLQNEGSTFDGLANTIKNTDENWEDHLGKSKVPTLRNIAVTAPYMSNGVFTKLRTVLEFYDHMGGSGIHPTNPETGNIWGTNDHNQTINNEDLTQNEMTDRKIYALEAFLRLLTDAKYEPLLPELAPEGELGN